MVSASSRSSAHQCANPSSTPPFDDPPGEIDGLPALGTLRSPIWIFDLQSCGLLWANSSACLLLDAPDLRSLLARSLPCALSDPLRNCLKSHRDTLARGETVQLQWCLPSGSRDVLVDCLCSATRLRERDALLVEGRVMGSRREFEESRATFDAILANASMGIAIVDRERRILRVNQAMVDIFQRPADSLVGAATRVIYSDDAIYEEVGRRAYPVLRRGGVFRDSFPMVRGNGSEVWCSLTGRRICPDDDSLGYVWMVEDISVRRRAEQTLNDSVAFQRVLLDTAPVPIFIQDVSGYYVNANAAFEQWLGIDRQSLFGRTVADVASAEHAERDEEADRLLLAGGGTRTFETRVRCADGSQRDVVVSKAIYCRSGDKPAGIVGTMADISERKHAEQALRERHALFEQMFVSSRAVKLLVDPAEGVLVDANPAAADFYGHPLETMRGMPLSAITAPATTIAPASIAPATIASTDMRGEPEVGWALHEDCRTVTCGHRLSSGERRDVEVYSSPVQVNGRTLLLSLVHDITERRRAEEALRRKTAELERSNEELEAFAYVASHDLRQPLRVINSYLTLLERSLAGRLDEETGEFIGFARDGAQRMDRLIVDLLEYSRVGRRARPFRPVPLGQVVETALLNLQVAVAECGGRVVVRDPLPTVAGDEVELVRLLQNLIGNAVKYRLAGRAPVVEIACAVAADGWRLCVRDNGIGIAPEHHDRVFGIFQRLHRRDEYEGTGVGLAICKKIVEHHGGRIWLDSAPGEGSAFFFSLPAGDGGRS